MDEIAKEYDVIVLGTGMSLVSHLQPRNVGFSPEAIALLLFLTRVFSRRRRQA